MISTIWFQPYGFNHGFSEQENIMHVFFARLFILHFQDVAEQKSNYWSISADLSLPLLTLRWMFDCLVLYVPIIWVARSQNNQHVCISRVCEDEHFRVTVPINCHITGMYSPTSGYFWNVLIFLLKNVSPPLPCKIVPQPWISYPVCIDM